MDRRGFGEDWGISADGREDKMLTAGKLKHGAAG